MIVLHTGFDGLDLALKASPSPDLVAILEAAKNRAAETQSPSYVTFNGVSFHVAETGGKGGYAFSFDTGPDGATWFVKKPKPGDPWSVRLSCHSRGLALKGLDAVRREIEATCQKLNLCVPHDGVSIGRVDFAIDLLAPGFELVPEHFIMHARTRRRTFADLQNIATHGPSGRYTSVTIGKQPGRQVIVYDKREEVLHRRKQEWSMIWNETLKRLGQPEIDLADRHQSQVWRVELRLGKKALRDRANIRGWSSFYSDLQAEMDMLATDVSLHIPSGDSNRSRWPLHPIWRTAQHSVTNKLFEHAVTVPLDRVREVGLVEKQQEFLRTLAAHAVTLSVLEGHELHEFSEFLERLPQRVAGFLIGHPRDIETRFISAREKYSGLLE